MQIDVEEAARLLGGSLPGIAKGLEAGGVYARVAGRSRDEVLSAVVRLMRVPDGVDRGQLRDTRAGCGGEGAGDTVALPLLLAPAFFLAPGACATSGGPFAGFAESSDGAAAVVPVDLCVPGCPPHPLTLFDGLRRPMGRLR